MLLGQGRRLEAVYAARSLTLSTVAAQDGAVMVAWLTEFTGYSLYSKTNLIDAGWTPVPSSGNQYMESPPVPQAKFFRLF